MKSILSKIIKAFILSITAPIVLFAEGPDALEKWIEEALK